MFINLTDEKVYCLPDGYEVIDNSLSDIKYNLKPVFTKQDIDMLDTNPVFGRALDGTEYIPGCIGLNNIKKTDYVNVILQGLFRVTPFRDFMLSYDDSKTDLVSI
jgi:U4/U6.U5 tri-snRNP-associated protein 2